jgi:hypothetical protein
LIAPPDNTLVNDPTIQIDAGLVPTRVSIFVGEAPDSMVARHERLPSGDYTVLVSTRARDADVTRALASELAVVHRLVAGDHDPRSQPARGLEGRAAEARVLLENLDRSCARGGVNLDQQQISKDLHDLFRSLQIDASLAGRQRLAALLGHDPPRMRRAVMLLDGMEMRPTLDASSDLTDFASERDGRLKQLRQHAHGDGVDDLVVVEDLALGAQFRMEEGHRIFDPINQQANVARAAGVQKVFNGFRQQLAETLNDATIPTDRKQALLAAHVAKMLAAPRLERVSSKIDTSAVQHAFRALSATGQAQGAMLLDPATGELSMGDPSASPRSLRDLMHKVDVANQAATDNGIATEYVIVIHRPGARGDGTEAAHVEVLARRPLRSWLRDRTSPGLPDHEGPGDLIIDVGVGRGNLAAELVARNDAHIVVQTEHIGAADVGQISREMPGIADAGPLAMPGALMVYGDVLSRLDLLREAEAEAGTEGIRRMFINNVSARFTNLEQYRAVASQLVENMAERGTFEIQWTSSAENAAGDSRGHIDGDVLVPLVDQVARANGRSIEETRLVPVPYEYTINASRRRQAGADDLAVRRTDAAASARGYFSRDAPQEESMIRSVTPRACMMCSESGRCPICGGTELHPSDVRGECPTCKGSKLCFQCRGKGQWVPPRIERPLRTTADAGFAVCSACNGTRYCQVCGGTTIADEGGACSACESGACDLCHDAGQVPLGTDGDPTMNASNTVRLILEMGSEFAPDDPIGREILSVAENGDVSYEHRRKGTRARHGMISEERVAKLLEYLAQSTFPDIPEHSIPPGASLMTLRREGRSAAEATFRSYFAYRLPGYGDLLRACEQLATALRKDDAAALAAWGFKATPAAGGA